ncbi:hypothetical protein CLF_103553, partial [Clonorchis sinensis]
VAAAYKIDKKLLCGHIECTWIIYDAFMMAMTSKMPLTAMPETCVGLLFLIGLVVRFLWGAGVEINGDNSGDSDTRWMRHRRSAFGQYWVMIGCWVQSFDQSDFGFMPASVPKFWQILRGIDFSAVAASDCERQPLNDKNKTGPENMGESLDPVYQSVNP